LEYELRDAPTPPIAGADFAFSTSPTLAAAGSGRSRRRPSSSNMAKSTRGIAA
jgi:hypothetical protein